MFILAWQCDAAGSRVQSLISNFTDILKINWTRLLPCKLTLGQIKSIWERAIYTLLKNWFFFFANNNLQNKLPFKAVCSVAPFSENMTREMNGFISGFDQWECLQIYHPPPQKKPIHRVLSYHITRGRWIFQIPLTLAGTNSLSKPDVRSATLTWTTDSKSTVVLSEDQWAKLCIYRPFFFK